MHITNNTFSGDPVEDIEIAKRLIARYPDVDVGNLIRIAADQALPDCSRVAAIYTLGFVDDNARSRATLSQIAANKNEPASIIDHASEALGYMRA